MKNASHATASVIISTLTAFGIKEILGGRQGFINVDTEMLLSDTIEILPPENIGFDLQDSIVVTPALVDRCTELKKAGFVLALDGHEHKTEYEDLYQLVDIIKVDLMQTPIEHLHLLVTNLRRYKCKLLAEKVDSLDAFQMCKRLGFDYFQGYYFARPSVVEKKGFNESQSTILRLLRLLISDASLEEIEKVFRVSPGMTYKLLMLVNSVSFGVREKIRDVRHALSILGRQQLKRWVQLTLFSSENSVAMDNPLVEMAAARAAFMEQLAQEHPLLIQDGTAADQAFMVGILSLLDDIYQISIEQIVSELNLSDAVKDALIGRKGIYGQMLEMTVLMERFELGAGALGLQEMGISLDSIIDSQIKALTFREAMD